MWIWIHVIFCATSWHWTCRSLQIWIYIYVYIYRESVDCLLWVLVWICGVWCGGWVGCVVCNVEVGEVCLFLLRILVAWASRLVLRMWCVVYWECDVFRFYGLGVENVLREIIRVIVCKYHMIFSNCKCVILIMISLSTHCAFFFTRRL